MWVILLPLLVTLNQHGVCALHESSGKSPPHQPPPSPALNTFSDQQDKWKKIITKHMSLVEELVEIK
jgi:hypothetical protein